MTPHPGPRRVAILAPMPAELRPLVRLLSLRRTSGPGPVSHRGHRGDVEILAAMTGIGLERAARVTEQLLDAAAVDHVLVVGVAGGIGPSVAIGDLVVPERVLDVSSGAAHRSAPLGDVAPRGTLVSSGGLIVDRRTFARLEREGAIAVDMETAAVAGVCAGRGLPFSAFRGISDRADDGSIDAAVFALARPDGRPDLRAVLRFVATRPGRIPGLVRLARGLGRATHRAATACVEALDAPASGVV